MSRKLYTSDLHLGHHNILRYCSRPFKSILEHDQVLIDNWNKKVSKNDLVYIVGDFTMITNNQRIIDYAKQLNGQIILIKGNHDKNNYPQGIFSEIVWYKEIRDIYEGQVYKVILFHYAIEFWQGAFGKDLRGQEGKITTIHLHGHSHGLATIRPNRFDVGVDNWNYEPVTLKEILNSERTRQLDGKKIYYIDRHCNIEKFNKAHVTKNCWQYDYMIKWGCDDEDMLKVCTKCIYFKEEKEKEGIKCQ